MTPREKALKNIQDVIRQKRREIAPDVLLRAQKVALEHLGGAGVPVGDMLPYDTGAARKAVALFLKEHPDPEDFCRRLSTHMAAG